MFAQRFDPGEIHISIQEETLQENFANEPVRFSATLGAGVNTSQYAVAYQYRTRFSSDPVFPKEWDTPKFLRAEDGNASSSLLFPYTGEPVPQSLRIYNPGPRFIQLRLALYEPGASNGPGGDNVRQYSNVIDFIVKKRPPSDWTPTPGVPVGGELDPSDIVGAPEPEEEKCPTGPGGQKLSITKVYGIDGHPLEPNINALRVTTSGEISIAFDIARLDGLDDGATAYHQYRNGLSGPWKRSPEIDEITFTLPGNDTSYTIPAYTDEFIIGEECEDELRELKLADIHRPGPRAVRLVVIGGNEDGGDYISHDFPFTIGQEPFICEGNVLKFNTLGKRINVKTATPTIRVSITNPDNAPGLFYAPIYIYTRPKGTDNYGEMNYHVGGGFSIDGGCVQDYVLKIADAPVIEGWEANHFVIRLRPRVAGSAWIDSTPIPMNNKFTPIK